MWTKRWIRKQRSIKKAMRGSHLFKLLGQRIMHPPLWKVDYRSLAGGLALGLFINFTPTIPFQMFLATIGALILKVNLPIALAACWITNPVTMVPIFGAAFRFGKFLLTYPEVMRNFIDAYVPDVTGTGRIIRHSLYLWTGSLIFASVAAPCGYGIIWILWRLERRVVQARKAAAARILPALHRENSS